MSWVEVRRTARDRQWKVGISNRRPAQREEVKAEEGRLDTRVEKTIFRVLGDVQDPLWRLEIGKHATQLRPELVAAAFLLADRALAAADEPQVRLAMRIDDAATVARITAMSIARGGGKVRGVARLRALAGWRWVVAVPVAFAIHIGLLLRYASRSRPIPADRRLFFAIHGERSNRTRHLLPPRFDPGRQPVFVLLGRPRASLRNIARTLDPQGRMPDMVLVRPASFSAALRSLPWALSRLGWGLRVLRQTPIAVSSRSSIGMAYRFFYGACQAAWWRGAGLVPEVVAFGHTGIADTTALEQAMQERGARTVHCVHGLSLGWNFAGLSDIGLFACGRDAGLAERFGGYGRATSVPSPMPDPVAGDERWLVMTAYSHPMNPAYASLGIGPDLEVLEAVGEAARRLGQDPSAVFWRPHPAIERIDAEDRDALQKAASGLGFSPWPEDLPYKESARFGIVMTTPSTAAIDLLRLGCLPVIVATAHLQAEAVYGSFPFVARSARQLREILDGFARAPKGPSIGSHRSYRTTWETVQPGGPLTAERILQATEEVR